MPAALHAVSGRAAKLTADVLLPGQVFISARTASQMSRRCKLTGWVPIVMCFSKSEIAEQLVFPIGSAHVQTLADSKR